MASDGAVEDGAPEQGVTEKDASEKSGIEKGERIAKRLARAGLCSRRDAERWIEEGRVKVNGTLLTSPAVTVSEGDSILVDGQPLPDSEKTRLWRYHKPARLMTTHNDPLGRETVFDNLPEGMPRVISVGRLDYHSEGLLLLTNDGELARRLELPSNAWVRRYRVRLHGIVDTAKLAALENGVTVEGVQYGPIIATLDRQKGSNAWLTISLKEGKNREIRRVMEHLGWVVTRLIRVAYGPFQLGVLDTGAVEEVTGKVLREQLGGGEEKIGTAKRRPDDRHTPEPAKKARRPDRGDERRDDKPRRAERGDDKARRPERGEDRPRRPERDGDKARRPERGEDRPRQTAGTGKPGGKPSGKPTGRPAGKPAGKPDANRRRPS